MLRSLLRAIVLPVVLWGTTTRSATFDITFIGTAPDAQANAAVQHAADIWAGILVSDVPIKVRVAWFPLGAGTLGITFPNGRKDFTGAPVAATWYATALANSITGSEQNPGENDIDVFLNNGLNIDWYSALDGNPGGGQYDLVSVALHELGHGLGFVGLAKRVGGEGSFGLLENDGFQSAHDELSWPELDTLPGIFDHFRKHLRWRCSWMFRTPPSHWVPSSLATRSSGTGRKDCSLVVGRISGSTPPAPSHWAAVAST
ncbi:MAG: hypothetical protein IPK99_07960 [Flavobacteriales bacterium]|nr:hypothetical protein [Flavobacteriales bacterium]